ncbi:MAG: CYTH domain-containing protein [Thiotrichaceae bacterium]|nr:CYTH domain-containing protein [Thiotrichaceae bacterium]
MGIEIERKYLLSNNEWRKQVRKQVLFQQGYLANNEKSSVRIRIEGDVANINIKSMTLGRSRSEFEYVIPLSDAEELMNTLCFKPIVKKTRYWVDFAGKCWEIDAFNEENQGLIVAEIELDAEDEVFEVPSWIGKEVTHLERYYNMCLREYPFSQWTDKEKEAHCIAVE